ncbi:DUF4233 domain-containing protein [Gryllotalpicola ginsengisoli]|uniref:DUF4233 domain-containing protein n=1 Tax=Gryllotalpicola ginsengisoli TaxID=444608 RepID=UPI0003B32146|nr:DUF4233 domain-containing protein [Gryllotalpicola ginsengisoli]
MSRERGIRESLGSIVLGFELVILFLGALVAFGLKVAPAPVALGGGAVLIVLSVAAIALMRHLVGVWLGWLVQLLALVSGIWVHMMFVVGLIFLAIWTYCMVTAGKIERQKSAQRNDRTENPT